MSRAGVPPVLKDIDHGVSQPVAQCGDFEYELQLHIQKEIRVRYHKIQYMILVWLWHAMCPQSKNR